MTISTAKTVSTVIKQLLAVVVMTAASAAQAQEKCTAESGDGPIFFSKQYCFYPDRMESFDCYPGVFRSGDRQSITKDGDPAYAWRRQHPDNLTLKTPYPILDAVFGLAVDEMLDMVKPAGTASAQLKGDSPGGKYYYPYSYFTHGKDVREYSRDSAQHVQLGDSVLIAPEVVRGTLLRRCDLDRQMIREDAVVTADSVHFIPAAWEYFKITGDQPFLKLCWDAMWNTMRQKERLRRKADGLWTGSPWSDGATGFRDPQHFDKRNEEVESFYGNIVAAGAWRDLAEIAQTLGKTGEARTCRAAYAALKDAINRHLYRPELGTYCYYKYVPTGECMDYREDISAGMVYIFGVADASRALQYHARFHPTPYGHRNVDPPLPSGEATYHGGNVWENQQAYHGWMLALLNRPDELKPFIFWHARTALPLKQWREGTINPSTGLLHSNYKHLTWGAMGYTSYWTRGVFGIVYETNGLRFKPCVPNDFGADFHAELNNVNYRRSRLSVSLHGRGVKLQQIFLDGKPVIVIPTDLVGQHHIEIRMAAAP